jgi:hypothetical protein
MAGAEAVTRLGDSLQAIVSLRLLASKGRLAASRRSRSCA